MITFKSLTIRNFLSYGNAPTTLTLDDPGTTIILGENLDDTSDGKEANGVGKTVWINALSYALFDKVISNIDKDNLINDTNKKNMVVTLDFTKNGTNYRILRARKTKSYAAGNFVKLYERHGDFEFADEDDITPDSVDNTNKFIQDLIGFDHAMFTRIVIFSASNESFLNLPATHVSKPNQRNMIESLFGLTILTEKAEILKEQIKDTKHALEGATIRVETLKKEHERYQQQISSAENRISNWEDNRIEELKDLNQQVDQIAEIDNINLEEQRELTKLRESAMQSILDLDKDIRQWKRELEISQEVVDKRKKELIHLKSDECPYCHQQFVDTGEKINECRHELEDRSSHIKHCKATLKRFKEQQSTFKETVTQLDKQITVKDVDKLYDMKNKSDIIRQKIIDLENAINPHTEALEELLTNAPSEINFVEVNAIQEKLDHQEFLLKLLTKKDSFVRKTLLDRYLPFLNSRLQHYLIEAGLPQTVKFTHELKAEISHFGRIRNFGQLSAGQQARVNIALSLAFRDVLQSLHTSVNLLMLDEVLDHGLSSVGVRKAAKMLKQIARKDGISMFIISHRDEIGAAFDKAIMITMERDFSYLRYI